MSRTLALCADDFGAAPNISEAIVELAAEGRLSALSCLANGTGWTRDAPALRGLGPEIDVGLHFNLSEGRPLSPALAAHWPRLPALPRLIALAHFGRLPLDAVHAELEAQLQAFVAAVGRAPAHLDGHQHVHHLPGVRELVCGAALRLQPAPAVRHTGRVLGPGYRVKRLLIEATGGRALGRRLRAAGIAHNPALTGVYDFEALQYRTCMQRWLAALPAEGALLFCHPGAASASTSDDPIGAARVRELAYLRSAGFAADLAAADVRLGRVWRVAGPPT
jgi:predicted glycoside hydrolase/deacetylase ChbG (UPF0249 family)